MDEKPILSNLRAEYVQERDCLSSKDEDQILTIEAEDGGGGFFLILKTERWAINSVDELVDVLNDFKKRLDLIKSDVV